MSAFQFAQIGVIRSPYKEKFAVPRQPGLVKHGGGELHLVAPYNQADAVRGLESFSHLWILFVFHQTMEGGWRPTVRPPRLGGNARMGVQRFALIPSACRSLSSRAFAVRKIR